jgi:hypothetical protein
MGQDVQRRFAGLGIGVPEIMLPKADVDLQKWAVIACDQFTQDHAYWDQAARFAGGVPSTFHIIFPEIYLEDPGKEERIEKIHRTMTAYLKQEIFAPPEKGLVYLERSTPYQKRRRGLIVMADMERYDWKKDVQPLIRATEGTVEERLPPRMAVRRGAALDCSHVLLLIDDEEDRILSELGKRAKTAPPLYQTPLTAGCISGWLLKRETDWTYLADELDRLVQKSVDKYGGDPFLFAVGDGNHSLASAKGVWEEYKALHAGDPDLMRHPCRYALVEVENLYDPGIGFEPIHRLILGADKAEVLALLSELPHFTCRDVETKEAVIALTGQADKCRLGILSGAEYALVEFQGQGFATDYLQPLLDDFTARTGYKIDYIHGHDALFSQNNAGVGLLLPPISKTGLFKTVARRGPLPRKSFSLGEAEEKRFYLDVRALF